MSNTPPTAAPDPGNYGDRHADSQTDSHADAIIIGAGVIGNAISFELARRGHRVINIDKGPAAGFGSTANSSAIVRFSYSTPTGVSLSWEGKQYWANWADYLETNDERGLISFVQCGIAILLTGNEAEGDHTTRVRSLWDQLAVPYEEWSAEELRQKMPVFDLGVHGPPKRPENDDFWVDAEREMIGALFSPDAGYVNDPQLGAHNLQVAAEAKGSRFRFHTEVVGIETIDGRCAGVKLADGEVVRAPVVVNACGPYSQRVNQIAGVYDEMNIKTKPMRHEVHQVPGPSDVDFSTKGFVTADDDQGMYFRPQQSNNILIGSLDAPCDPHDYVDPDDYNPSITEDQWQAQVLRLNKRIPSLGMPHRRMGIVDLYDVADDWIPIYDRTRLDGFYVAVGTSGNQYKNAPAAGHLMAELIEAVEGGRDHDRDPLQITGRFTGHPMDLSTFSRNRVVHADSSMSVLG